MVKSRTTRKALPATTYCYASPPPPSPPVHAQQDMREGVTAAPMVAEDLAASDRPPSRSPGYRRVRDELSKLSRMGSVLNYSDEQSSNNGEDDDVEPTSSANSTAPVFVTDLKEKLGRTASASEAALAFQRWRISSLKVLFTQDLNKVLTEAQQNEARVLALEEDMEKKERHLVHALADCAQLRSQLCALESVNRQNHESSDMEALQMDLMKALERATSSEAEVERYNKEIRKLRERLKSMEDEASRLDSELKATVSFLQKEKDGVAKENQVLLEQLSRKDEEVLSQTQEINTLRSMLACLRVSRLELERLKNELQGTSGQRLTNATPETLGNTVLQSQMELKNGSIKASADVEEQSLPSGPVLSQLLDVLQKLTVCLHKNEVKYLHLCITCWKWRWVSASSALQALSKEIKMLKSVSKDNTGSIQQSSFLNCLDAFRVSLVNQDLENTQEPSLDLQAPVSFNKVFALLVSIWKLSSQSAYQEKEAFQKGKQLDHLLRIMTRWMQRALKKRQLQRVITHWLRYLLQSWKDKFKLQYNVALHLKQGSSQPEYAPNSVPHVQKLTSSPKARNAESLLMYTSKVPQNVGKDAHAHSCKDQALQTLQESLHKRLEDLEAGIMKEASHWHQQHLGKGDREPVSVNLVWKLYCELERCFSEARNQIMTYFGVFNKVPSSNNMEKKNSASPLSSKLLAQIKVRNSKKPVERHSSVQAIARKRKKIFI
ncbi:hypothetical protein GOP47_0015245 [Adiantum capillus-veneris]|uniref:Uncharacterized protein n=1 Tax=Adiantum capillus-veneris TaxID=13818 RepID=A0A9D4UJB4_ADICA|nr:hypothetical protein GOP47_0015245 [Adiantum capillus-veneris]